MATVDTCSKCGTNDWQFKVLNVQFEKVDPAPEMIAGGELPDFRPVTVEIEALCGGCDYTFSAQMTGSLEDDES